MPLEPAFLDDAAYGPGGVLLDEILAVDLPTSLIRVRMPTHDDLPLTREQRVHPKKHPRHVSGGLMVHMTGMAAMAHAHYVLELRHSDGWTGYGVRIHNARFVAIAPPGEPIEIECQALMKRRLGDKLLVRYRFRFTQQQAGVSKLVYESEQSAMFMRITDDAPVPAESEF